MLHIRHNHSIHNNYLGMMFEEEEVVAEVVELVAMEVESAVVVDGDVVVAEAFVLGFHYSGA